MKRLHIHLAVENLTESIRFYSTLFASAPNVAKSDYAKWMLDDPRVNFAISTRGAAVGLNHLGMQVEAAEELDEIHARLRNLDVDVTAETGAACCYARSDKYWITDPQGIAWESFQTLGDIPFFGDAAPAESECCVPSTVKQDQDGAACCVPTQSIKATSGACC